MKPWNSQQPVDRRIRALASLFVIGLIYSAVANADDGTYRAKGEPASAGSSLGSEVVLKVPDLPIFDQGRPLSGEDHLTFTVEQSESGRLRLVSRDKAIRGWVYDEEVVSLEQATDYFNQVVLYDKFNLDAYWLLGRLWFYKNDHTRALIELNRSIGRLSDQADYYLSRSLVFLRQRQIKKALADCEILPAPRTRFRTGPSGTGKGPARHPGLCRCDSRPEQAFRFDPVNPYPRGPAPDAQKEENADETPAPEGPGPQTVAGLVASGENWFARQEYDKAIKDFNAAIKLDPGPREPMQAARSRAPKHYRDRELADISEAIKLEPANAVYRVARAETWSARVAR